MDLEVPRLSIELLPHVAWQARPDGSVKYLNHRWYDLTGLSKSQSLGGGWISALPMEDAESKRSQWQSSIARGLSFELEFRLKHAAANLYRWHRGYAEPDCDGEGKLQGWFVTCVDIDREVEAERLLLNTENGFRALFTNNPQAMWLWDMDTLFFLEVNAAAVDRYGFTRDEFLAMKVTEIRPPEDIARFMNNLGSNPRQLRRAGHWRHVRKDGAVIDVDIMAHQLDFGGRRAVLSLVNDISEQKRLEDEQKRLEEKLRQSQKMEAIGLLAGGVAHDFNNLLTVINGYSDLLLSARAPENDGVAELTEILKAGERAAALTSQLLAFSRQQILVPQTLNLNTVVGNIHRLLQRIIGEDIQLAAVLAPGLFSVSADPHQIGQVVMNLAVNARDAMPNGGHLTIETANVQLDGDYPHEVSGTAPGPYAVLSVTDTGHGMDAATRSRIFDPFFTTKGQGRGTGLGLSTVYGIVKQTGGAIAVYSEPERGTTFRIYLPAVAGDAQAIPVRKAPELSSGSETILIVEDDEIVRKLAVRILEPRGYRLLIAADAAEAIEIAGRPGVKLDLLLSDLILPGISGGELSERIRALHPNTKVVLMSGYTEHAAFHQKAVEEGAHFLQKPFTALELASKVHEAISSQGTDA